MKAAKHVNSVCKGLTVYAMGPIVNQERFQNTAGDFVIQVMILEFSSVWDHTHDECCYVLTIL